MDERHRWGSFVLQLHGQSKRIQFIQPEPYAELLMLGLYEPNRETS